MKRETTPLSDRRSQACLDSAERVGIHKRTARIATNEGSENPTTYG